MSPSLHASLFSVAKRGGLFYLLVTISTCMLMYTSFFSAGRLVSLAVFVLSICMLLTGVPTTRVYLVVLGLALVSPERLSDYFIELGYGLFGIYGTKVVGVSLVHWILLTACIGVWLRKLRLGGITVHPGLLFFAYLMLVPLIIGVIRENEVRSILADMAPLMWFFLAALVSWDLMRIPMDAEALFLFLVFCMQLRTLVSTSLNVAFPFVGASIYLNYAKYLDGLVIVFPALASAFDASRSYRAFCVIAAVAAAFEMLYAADRKQFVLTALFLVLIVPVLVYRWLKASKGHISLWRPQFLRICMVVGTLYLVVAILPTEILPAGALGRFFYKLRTIPLVSNVDNPSVALRIIEFKSIWEGLVKEWPCIISGMGFGSLFEFDSPIPAEWLGPGSYVRDQIVTGRFQPHTVVNFLMLKTGVLGTICYSCSYAYFTIVAWKTLLGSRRRTAVVGATIFASLPTLAMVSYVSVPVALTGGLLFSIAKMCQKSSRVRLESLRMHETPNEGKVLL